MDVRYRTCALLANFFSPLVARLLVSFVTPPISSRIPSSVVRFFPQKFFVVSSFVFCNLPGKCQFLCQMGAC